ncbi:MAG TPA: glucoamylase family protein [Thermoanaerobaculia bacterium]|nr:glucoamylase family protein [Thermoanaerobaculia bacterium]
MTAEKSSPFPAELFELQRHTFAYFVHEANPANGLVRDNSRYGAPSSIAAVGLALACWPIGVERGIVTRDEAVERVLATLSFFEESEKGEQPDATGHHGFFYHFLDLETGRRAHGCELSTMDTTILLAGGLTAAAYFDRDSPKEERIRRLADSLYRAAEWEWMLDGANAVRHGWTPEGGFLPFSWRGFSEALLLYALALGSPTHAPPAESYAAWTETYEWKCAYGIEYLSGGPLFMHQLSHLWIDFRGIRDEFMRHHGIDYFENSRRATWVQQRYAKANPQRFRGYSKDAWGITASDGPGPAVRRVSGRTRRFYDYCARGAPDGPDDGTLSPWAVVTSLPFAPEVVLSTFRAMLRKHPGIRSRYGFLCSFNPTFDAMRGGWVAKGYYGLDQGPVVIMIENAATGLIWNRMRRCQPLVNGLRRAGFSGGWLG